MRTSQNNTESQNRVSNRKPSFYSKRLFIARATAMMRDYNMTRSEAFKKAWEIVKLYKRLLTEKSVSFIYIKNTEDNIESFRSQGYHDITELEQMAKNKIDLFLKKQEQQRLRREALDDFTSRCKEYRPGGYCHKYPPYKCAICRCHPKHEFLWDYDERHGLMHTFG